MKKDVQEVVVPVHNLFLMKQIVEEDGGLTIIGTFIQHCYEDDKTKELLEGRREEEEIKFDYRFNDETADEDSGYTQHRRTEKHEGTDMGTVYRHTYQVKAPLDVDVAFDFFPFRVVSAKLLVELSTFTTPDNETRLRPNILLHVGDKTNMFCIQKDSMKKPRGSSFEQAKDRLDKTESYDFVSPFPKVAYLYDTGKRYCPKFLMTFVMVEDGMKKFVEIVAPMFLIAVMNTIHVLNPDDGVDTADYIANSATFALSVLVFLPTMIGTSRVQQLWTVNNLYIMFIFVSLTLSSIPDTFAGTKNFAIVGMILNWVSFVFPIVNSWRYMYFIRHARQKANSTHFWPSGGKKPYKASSKKAAHEFAKVEQLVLEMTDEERLRLEYKFNDIPEIKKIKILEFASRTSVSQKKKNLKKEHLVVAEAKTADIPTGGPPPEENKKSTEGAQPPSPINVTEEKTPEDADKEDSSERGTV